MRIGRMRWLGTRGRRAGRVGLFAAAALVVPTLVSAGNVGFVRAQGGQFVLNGSVFRFVGTNAYYMAIMTALGSPAHADDQIALAQALGFTVMRVWGFADGPSDGMGASAFQPSAGVYNETSFQALDYVLYKADLAGIRLIIPLVNGNPSYGGYAQYLDWCAPGGSERTFYESGACRSLYKSYVAYVLNRVNTYNGRRYKDDPTVFAWELANEPHVTQYADPSGQVMTAWVADLAAYFKSIDSNHMVATGEEGYDTTAAGYSGLAAYNGQAWLFDGNKGSSFQANTADPHIDFGSIHLYPEYWNLSVAQGSTWIADHARIARALGKPLVLGEFGASQNTAASFDGWMTTWEAEQVGGALAWQVMCRVCSGMGDQFTIAYPPSSGATDVLAGYAAIANVPGPPVPADPGTPSPPAAGPGSPVAGLGLTVNRTSFSPGQTAEVVVVPPTSGSDTGPVDVYLGALLPAAAGAAAGCPAGDAVVFLADGFAGLRLACASGPPSTFAPLARNVAAADVATGFTFVWTPDFPPGVYTFFVALTRAGALADGAIDPGDVLGLAAGSAAFSR